MRRRSHVTLRRIFGSFLVLYALLIAYISLNTLLPVERAIQRYYNVQRQKVVFKVIPPDLYAVNYTKERPTVQVCLSPYTGPLSSTVKSRLAKKAMLSYFNMGSGYYLSIPEWQKRLDSRALKTDGKKYYLTSVLRVRLYADDKAKWTIRELKQWLHYQFWAGSEHVYICNHFMSEKEKVDIHLKEYVERNLVTIYDWNHLKAAPGSRSFHHEIMQNQIGCYNHILKLHGQRESVWQYSLDMDENPYIPGDTCEGFLRRYLSRLDSRVAQVKLQNFVLQGQGDRSRDLLYDRMIRVSPKPFNSLTKAVYKTANTKSPYIHEVMVDFFSWTITANPEELRMLHYWGARTTGWGNDTQQMIEDTVEFTDVRDTLAVSVRHSLVAFGEFDAFSTTTGP